MDLNNGAIGKVPVLIHYFPLKSGHSTRDKAPDKNRLRIKIRWSEMTGLRPRSPSLVEVNAQHTWGISTSVEYKGLMWLTREIPVVYGVYFEALCVKKVFKSEPKLDF